MSEVKRTRLYKNIIGNAKDTIDAIQRYIEESSKRQPVEHFETEDAPAESINRILKAAACEDTQKDIQDFLKRI